MKKLITANDVKKAAETGKNILYAEPGTIITPAAKDAAYEFDVSITEEAAQPQQYGEAPPVAAADLKVGLTPELVARIVREVMISLSGTKQYELTKDADPGGLRLVRGKTVVCEKFNSGKPGDNVGIKEILTRKESPDMSAGFMTIEKTNFSWDLKAEEIDYIIEGTLEITVNGTTYRGEAGDIFYLPRDTTVTLSAPGKVKFFFVTHPSGTKF